MVATINQYEICKLGNVVLFIDSIVLYLVVSDSYR